MFRRSIPVLLALCALGAFSASASAVRPAPGLTLDSLAEPTNFSASENKRCLENIEQHVGQNGGARYTLCDMYVVNATNTGSQPTTGNVTLTDSLPEGVTVQRIDLHVLLSPDKADKGLEEFNLASLGLCSPLPVGSRSVSCEYPGPDSSLLPALEPDATLKMLVYVTVAPNAPEMLVNRATVSGGGAPQSSIEGDNETSSTSASFGPSNFDFYIAGVDGERDTQAGDHPYELATFIGFDNALPTKGREEGNGLDATGVEDVKDLVINLPLGFVGSTLAAPECSLADLSGSHCPAATIIGSIRTEPEGLTSINSPIYNLVPERGVPAEFGYYDGLHGSHPLYARVVPTALGYVLQTMSPDIPQIELDHIMVTFYGDPASRNASTICGVGNAPKEAACREALENARVPFFTNPTGCDNGPLKATLYMDSWRNPAKFNSDGTPVDLEEPEWAKMESVSPPVTGCNALSFTPELVSKPTTEEADTPSGMELEMKFPQTENPDVSATSELRDATVTFPAGLTLDPSSGDGLQGCSEAQIGWLGKTPKNFSPAEPECPEASKIGSLEVTTPLIPRKLTGEMYLANQDENPYGSVIGLYVVVQDPITGVLIKIAGKTVTNPQTGQITGVFEENPQFPIDELKLSFFGGPRAEFATPNSCGSFQTTSVLEPWSLEGSELPATPFASFPIETGCVNGFSPTFAGLSTNLQAGAYSAFEGSFTRSDSDQEIGGLTVTLPPGMSANLSDVPLCGEAQANAGTCPEASQIGTVIAGAGPGPNPLIDPGKAYLTGPYNGGAFGMSVVVPAIAGPFDFGSVVVRQSIRINPLTAQVTDVSNPFPTLLNPKTINARGEEETIGIPIRLRRVDFDIDGRPGHPFVFNPTNCGKLQVGGSMTSTQGAGRALEDPFQVTNCAALNFAPKFKVSTSGHTSRADGASLTATLSEPNLPFGSEANIARVKVDLPKQLPSRLTTLQKACTATQFEADPAGCPPASRIGYAVVHTPIVSVPLEGPAIFVSHGGEAFPSLTVVLQGDGITINLVGATFISSAGITSTTFKTVPDTPFSTFTLTLPEGPYSALAAPGALCKAASLSMPTEFIAQNDTEIHKSTKIAVTGCGKAKKSSHKKKHTKKAKKRR
jgi:hypothetical protein